MNSAKKMKLMVAVAPSAHHHGAAL
jgi:hypothetical protein